MKKKNYFQGESDSSASTNITNSIESSSGLIECNEIYDSLLCWPKVSAGTIAKVSCRQVFRVMGVPVPKNSLDAIVTIGDQSIRFQGEFILRQVTKVKYLT